MSNYNPTAHRLPTIGERFVREGRGHGTGHVSAPRGDAPARPAWRAAGSR